jgi:hypothetical protein
MAIRPRRTKRIAARGTTFDGADLDVAPMSIHIDLMV